MRADDSGDVVGLRGVCFYEVEADAAVGACVFVSLVDCYVWGGYVPTTRMFLADMLLEDG